MNRKAVVTLNELDLRRAGRLHVWSSIRDPRVVIRIALLWAGAMVALVVFLGLAGMPWPELHAALPVFALVMAGVTFGFAFVFPLLIGPLVIHRRFRQDKLLRQAAEVSWNEDTYEVIQPGAHNRFAWTDYSKWRDGRHTFMFFRSDYTYQVLPKRVLTQEQIDDISRILSRG